MDRTTGGVDIERRSVLRVVEPFPGIVRGHAADGQRFHTQVTLDNLSANGAYFQLNYQVRVGHSLFLVIWMTTRRPLTTMCPKVAALGVVLRADQQTDGRYGVAVIFARHRFLFADTPV